MNCSPEKTPSLKSESFNYVEIIKHSARLKNYSLLEKIIKEIRLQTLYNSCQMPISDVTIKQIVSVKHFWRLIGRDKTVQGILDDFFNFVFTNCFSN